MTCTFWTVWSVTFHFQFMFNWNPDFSFHREIFKVSDHWVDISPLFHCDFKKTDSKNEMLMLSQRPCKNYISSRTGSFLPFEEENKRPKLLPSLDQGNDDHKRYDVSSEIIKHNGNFCLVLLNTEPCVNSPLSVVRVRKAAPSLTALFVEAVLALLLGKMSFIWEANCLNKLSGMWHRQPRSGCDNTILIPWIAE